MTETQETFLSHLIELRERLVRALVVYAIACVPTLYYSAAWPPRSWRTCPRARA